MNVVLGVAELEECVDEGAVEELLVEGTHVLVELLAGVGEFGLGDLDEGALVVWRGNGSVGYL